MIANIEEGAYLCLQGSCRVGAFNNDGLLKRWIILCADGCVLMEEDENNNRLDMEHVQIETAGWS